MSKKIAPEGFEPTYVMMKTLCLKPLDYKALYIIKPLFLYML